MVEASQNGGDDAVERAMKPRKIMVVASVDEVHPDAWANEGHSQAIECFDCPLETEEH